jgi:hypothetical protein
MIRNVKREREISLCLPGCRAWLDWTLFSRLLASSVLQIELEFKNWFNRRTIEPVREIPEPSRHSVQIKCCVPAFLPNYRITCAVDAHAGYIVTGDEDLLIFKKHKDIVIINPRNFEALFAD